MALKFQFAFVEGTQLETIVVDAAVSEGHSYSAEITEYPVEKGAAVTDNVRPKPDKLRFDVVISDFPLTNEGRQQVDTGSVNNRPAARKGRALEVLNKLIRLKDTGTLIKVETGLKTYGNDAGTGMVIESIEVPRDKEIKNAVKATITMKQIVIVETQTSKTQVAKERKGQSKVKGGPKTGEVVSPNKKGSRTLAAAEATGKLLEKVLGL